MKITQVECKGVLLKIGDEIVVKYKPWTVGGDELPEETKKVKIVSFEIAMDGEDIKVMGESSEDYYFEENFVSKINKDNDNWNEVERILDDNTRSLGTKIAYIKTRFNLDHK
jgi:hypothetical protein